jgi:hypothetical protein
MVSPPRVDQRLLVERWQYGSAIMIKGLIMLKLGTIYIMHRRNSTVVSSLRGVAHMRRCSGVGDAPATPSLHWPANLCSTWRRTTCRQRGNRHD